MRKMICSVVICVFMTCSILVLGGSDRGVPESAATAVHPPVPSEAAAPSLEKVPAGDSPVYGSDGIISGVRTFPNLLYDASCADYPSLAAGADVIVAGRVQSVTGYLGENHWVYSMVDLAVDEVLKGDPADGVVRFSKEGGEIPALGYYTAISEKLIGKFGLESYNAQVAAIRETDVVDHVFWGIENADAGDRLLLFLTYDAESETYVPLGSAARGLLFYDEPADSFYLPLFSDHPSPISLEELQAELAAVFANGENPR